MKRWRMDTDGATEHIEEQLVRFVALVDPGAPSWADNNCTRYHPRNYQRSFQHIDQWGWPRDLGSSSIDSHLGNWITCCWHWLGSSGSSMDSQIVILPKYYSSWTNYFCSEYNFRSFEVDSLMKITWLTFQTSFLFGGIRRHSQMIERFKTHNALVQYKTVKEGMVSKANSKTWYCNKLGFQTGKP